VSLGSPYPESCRLTKRDVAAELLSDEPPPNLAVLCDDQFSVLQATYRASWQKVGSGVMKAAVNPSAYNLSPIGTLSLMHALINQWRCSDYGELPSSSILLSMFDFPKV